MNEGKLGLIDIDLNIRFALICGTFVAGFYCIFGLFSGKMAKNDLEVFS